LYLYIEVVCVRPLPLNLPQKVGICKSLEM
jgi:hypothetical protein